MVRSADLTSLAAGLNEHVTEVAMMDVRGALSIGHDEGALWPALFEATNVAAMAFAPWCAVTLSLRGFVRMGEYCEVGAGCVKTQHHKASADNAI